MNWDLLDVVVLVCLIGAAAAFCALFFRRDSSRRYRLAAAVAALAAFLLFWVNGAVGIIGSENNDANLLYVGVLGILALGTFAARFDAAAMAFVMLATAAAQILVPIIAIGFNVDTTASASLVDIMWLTMFFSALWLLSAWLFGRVGTEDDSDAVEAPESGLR